MFSSRSMRPRAVRIVELMFAGSLALWTSAADAMSAAPAADEPFSHYVATLPQVDDWRFGRKVQAPAGGRTIRSAAELAVDFQPLQPWVGTTTINSELQRYASSFQPPIYQIEDDGLSIQAQRGRSSLNAVVGATRASGTLLRLDGTPNALDQFGIASTAGLSVGQLVVLSGRYGLLRIAAIVPDRSIALLPILHAPRDDYRANNSWILFIRAWWLQSTDAATKDATVLHVEQMPAGVEPGMTVFAEDRSGWNLISGNAMTVRSITSRSLTLEEPGFQASYQPPAGKGFVIYPAIASGQLWSRRAYGPPRNDQVVAMQFELQLPQVEPLSAEQMRNVYSRSRLLGLPRSLPWGAWTAVWLFQQFNGDHSRHADGSEIDFETWWMNSRGPGVWTGFNHGAPYTRVYRSANLGEWRSSPATAQLLSPDSAELSLTHPMTGRIRLQLVWTHDRVYRYLDDRLVSIDDFHWTSDFPASFGIDLAVGSFAGYYPANLLLPWNDAQLQRLRLVVHEITVWAQ